MNVEWSIQDVARHAGTTSRTLRHYAQIGLVTPTRIGANGYRYYDDAALVRLQRVLLLRELGLGLPAIADALAPRDDAPTEVAALKQHLGWLTAERDRLERQAASVRSTIDVLERGGDLMMETMFDGFDHTAHKREVEERWGSEASARSDAWWTSMGAEEKAAWQARLAALQADWRDAAATGVDPAGAVGQELARRQAEWLAGIPGTPGHGSGAPTADYLTGLGEMYAADERFAAQYGGTEGARFVRDALARYAEVELAGE